MIALALLALALGFALLTWSLGWWALVVAAMIAGAVWRRPAPIAAAAAISWLLLLVVDARGGRLGALSILLGGIFPVPGAVLMVVALLFAALAAWSAATVGAELVRLAAARD